MPLNIVMRNIGVKMATPDKKGNLPDFPITITEMEPGGAVNTVTMSRADATYLHRQLTGWLVICEKMISEIR